MSEFTKTLIVDASLQNPDPPYYNTIKEGLLTECSFGVDIGIER